MNLTLQIGRQTHRCYQDRKFGPLSGAPERSLRR